MEKIKLMLIDWLAKDDPKKLIRVIIKRHLEGYHVASNPTRKTKRATGPAMM
jgi:hypothetical protein